MLGVGVALGAAGFPEVPTPPLASWGLQVLIGILVGLGITRDSLRDGARPLLPAACIVALFLLSSLAAATAAIALTGITPVTAIFAAATGGLTEMATIGATQGASGPAVAAIHLSRLLLVIFAASLLAAHLRAKQPHTEPAPESGDAASGRGVAKLALIASAGTAGGALGLMFTSLAAAGVLGSLAGSGLARLSFEGPVPQRRFHLAVQALAGGIIGLGFTASFFQTLVQLAGAALVINAAQMLVWVLACRLLVRKFRFDLATATLASAPGGMGTIIVITGATDADMVAVAFIHLLRVSATIIVVPLLAGALLV